LMLEMIRLDYVIVLFAEKKMIDCACLIIIVGEYICVFLLCVFIT
jgi:hypothetical protein